MVVFANFIVPIIGLLVGAHALDQESANKIKEELIQSKIIPDAIDDFDLLTELKITYDENNVLKNGKSIRPEETLVVPNVWFEVPSNDTEYTLAMVNIDSHGPLVRHWIATNIQGIDERGTAFLSQLPKHQYTSYKGPTPPPGSALHRVAFVLFAQGKKGHTFTPDVDGTSLRNRAFFDLKQFAKDNSLTPISAAYFHTEYQEGFSQTYPPFVRDVVNKVDLSAPKEAKEAGLVTGLLDDVGNLVGHLLTGDDGYYYDDDYYYYDDGYDYQYDRAFDNAFDNYNDRVTTRRNNINRVTTTVYKSITVRPTNTRPVQNPRPTVYVDPYRPPTPTPIRSRKPPVPTPPVNNKPAPPKEQIKNPIDLLKDLLDMLSEVLNIKISLGSNVDFDDGGDIVITLGSAEGSDGRVSVGDMGKLEKLREQLLDKFGDDVNIDVEIEGYYNVDKKNAPRSKVKSKGSINRIAYASADDKVSVEFNSIDA